MSLRRAWLLPVFLLSVQPLAAQSLPISFAIDARVGRATPMGDFSASEDGFATESGIAWGIGASVFPARIIGIFAGYQRNDFGCEQCALLGLEDSAVVEGIEAGLHLALPLAGLPVAPWVRGGIVQQKLGFERDGDAMSSDPEFGYMGAVGVSIPLVRYVEISPSVRYFAFGADFDFPALPDPEGNPRQRSLDVTAYSLDLGVTLRF